MLKLAVKGFFFGLGFSLAVFLFFSAGNLISGAFFHTVSSVESLVNLPIEEKIDRSTVIVRTVHTGDVATIEDILIRDPAVDFDYKRGDEYYPLHSSRNGVRLAGDDRIILHTGPSADAVYATSYNLHDIARYGDDMEVYLLSNEQ